MKLSKQKFKGNKNGKVKGAQRVKGGKSHNKTLDSAGVPKTVQKNVKNTNDFKKGVEKQNKLEAERKKVSKYAWSYILNNTTLIATMAVLIGITLAKLLQLPKLVYG